MNACIKRVFRITLENLELIRACGTLVVPNVFIRSGTDRSIAGQLVVLCDVNKDNSTDRSISVNGAPFHFLTY